jgi:uncharacterized membrane-anchored protein
MTPLRLGLWIVLAVAQLCVPAWMITSDERVLRHGRQIKLQTRPVDPADLFRGRYVALGFAVEQVPRELVRGEFEHHDDAYLELREGANGLAETVALHKEKPAGDLVLKARVNFISPETIGVELPFNRYYMDENAAPAAEIAYRDQADEPENAWVTVRVLKGRGVIEELYLGGKPVREFLRQPTP